MVFVLFSSFHIKIVPFETQHEFGLRACSHQHKQFQDDNGLVVTSQEIKPLVMAMGNHQTSLLTVCFYIYVISVTGF